MTKTKKDSRIAVTERAIFQRLKRHLVKHYDQVLCKSRPNSRQQMNCGDYYTVDVRTNTLNNWHMNLEQWARDEKVMLPSEKLIKD